MADSEGTQIGEDRFIVGGDIVIDEPINGDLYILGDDIWIKSPIYGDVIAVGSNIYVDADVSGKVLLTASNVDMKGDVLKAIIFASDVEVRKQCNISAYAVILAGKVNFYGDVKGELRIISSDFEDNGTYGKLVHNENPFDGDFREAMFRGLEVLSFIFFILEILFAIGYLLLGLFILKYFRNLFYDVEKELVKSPVITTILGFILIISSIFATVLMMVTLVGIPFAVTFSLLSLLALMLSAIFVSLPLGRSLVKLTKREVNDYWLLILGLIVLRVLFWIPYIGVISFIITLSLGYGAIFYVVKNRWPSNRAK